MEGITINVCLFRKEKSSSIEKSASSSKNKSGSPKVHYIRDDDKEEQARLRKLGKIYIISY